MELKDLRNLMESAEPRTLTINNNNDTLDEVFLESCLIPLDEAFFGKNPIQPIQKAMDKIYDLVMESPNIVITNTSENKALENAIQKVFNFKSVSIEWSNSKIAPGYMTINAYTFTPSNITKISDSVKYGTFLNGKEGFKDSGKSKIYITLDTALFTEMGITSQEGVAMLLHEIGHNFDLSIMTVLDAWLNVFTMLYEIIISIPKGTALKTILTKSSNELIALFGRGIQQKVFNLNAYIVDAIPPLAKVGAGLQKFSINLQRFFSKLLAPTAVIGIPLLFLIMPFSYVFTGTKRAGERYADTFAATYGYSEELISALEKVNKYTIVDPKKDNTYVNVFGGLALTYREILCMTDYHQSNQTRLVKVMDKLEKDLKGVKDPNLKKDIQDELKRCRDLYNSIVNMPDDQRIPFLTTFRQMMDKWYNGKPYLLIDADGDYVYAQ